MSKIKTAVVGVGNCFSGLYLGIEYYKRNPKEQIIGILSEKIGEYSIFDIDFVAAFDVSSKKVGKDLVGAIFEEPNKCDWLTPDDFPEASGVTVSLSPELDGVGDYVRNEVDPIPTKEEDLESLFLNIVQELKEKEVEVVVSYLPVGSDKATKFWARVCLEAKVAFVNAMPSFIASDPEWEVKFKEAGIPIIGDDIKGQLGATIVHRTLARLAKDRGITIDQTYQLNVGGNTDFENMLQRSRLESKKISKTESVQSQLDVPLEPRNIHVGPSDYVPFLNNTKICFIRMKGRMWANRPYQLDLQLEVDDKANSAGIVIDAIRFAKKAVDEGKSGYQDVSAYYMKHPLKQMTDPEALKLVESERH